ncbi:HNH endonuclease [Psychrobacter alimentarius]|uniref:HNH endonuclease n=1 Tax=Psychrobacter alimentarius TaxID=261164 RepID=UPI003FD62E3F
MNLTKAQRAELKQLYGGHCSYCGESLGEKWDADHYFSIRRNWIRVNGKQVFTDCENPENDCIENMKPSCKPCNLDKGSLHPEDWREMIVNKIVCLNRDSATYQKAKRFGLVVETNIEVVFYFEKYNEERTA